MQGCRALCMLQQDSQPLAAVSSELICRIYMHLNMAAVPPT